MAYFHEKLPAVIVHKFNYLSACGGLLAPIPAPLSFFFSSRCLFFASCFVNNDYSTIRQIYLSGIVKAYFIMCPLFFVVVQFIAIPYFFVLPILAAVPLLSQSRIVPFFPSRWSASVEILLPLFLLSLCYMSVTGQ